MSANIKEMAQPLTRRSPIYINSADRVTGNPQDFKIRLVDVVQAFAKAKLSVISIQIPFSYFGITVANNTFLFEETFATPLTATIVPGNYTGAEVVSELLVRLNAAGASVYTGSFSNITGRMTLISDGAGGAGLFTILAQDIGFTANIPTGYVITTVAGLTHVSDNVIDLSAPHALYIHFSNFHKGFDSETGQQSETIVVVPVNVTRFGVIEHNPSVKFLFEVDRFLEDIDVSVRDPEGVLVDLNGLNWQMQLHIEERLEDAKDLKRD